VDLLLITHLPDIRWSTAFTGSNGLLLLTAERSILITDGRYDEQAHTQVTDAEVLIYRGKLTEFLRDHKLLENVGKLGFQADVMTSATARRYEEAFPEITFVPVEGLTAALRALKDAGEIATIRKAQAITDQVFEETLPLVKEGVTERDLATEIIYRQLCAGAERMPDRFDPIIASGPNSALAHARSSERPLQNGDAILFDFGCVVDGYCSDMSRTVCLGTPPKDFTEAYQAVLTAQEKAIAAIQPGAPVKAADEAARGHLQETGYADYFTYGLGHGVGLEIHERPHVSYASDEVFEVGMVTTIEPGLHFAGKFGLRIEDLVLVTETGFENLTTSPKELLVLPR